MKGCTTTKFILATTILIMIFGISIAFAKDEAKAEAKAKPDVVGKVEGKVYVNWHYDLTEDAYPAHAFDLNRAYFGYKMTVNKKFTGRVMLDVGRVLEVKEDDDGSLKKDSNKRYTAYLKYGYLEMKNVIPITTIKLGLHGLNQFSYQEKFWGYRYIYKSFMDQNKFGTSADLGLGISIKPVDQFKFNFNLTNGEGYKKPQIDKLYKAAFGTEIHIVEGLSTYLYGDIMPYQADKNLRPQGTVAAFIGYKLKKIFRIGVEYIFQANQGGDVTKDYNGLSAYTAVNVGIVDFFLRGDILSKDFLDVDENDDKKTSADIIVGMQIAPVKNLKISPNLQMHLPEGSDKKEPKIFINGEFNF